MGGGGCGLLTTVAPLVAKHGLWCPQTCSAAPGLESPGPVAVMHGLSCSATCGLPRPGVELASPALAGGRFFTIKPPGKPSGVFLTSFPRSYLVREAWEPGVLSHSAGSAIQSSGASSKRLPRPQSCLTLCLPGSSVHGISQARLLEWVAISFSIQGPFIRPFFTPQNVSREIA